MDRTIHLKKGVAKGLQKGYKTIRLHAVHGYNITTPLENQAWFCGY